MPTGSRSWSGANSSSRGQPRRRTTPVCANGIWARQCPSEEGRTVESKRSKLGSQIGLFLCLAGLILEWVGWNGAASYDRISEQFPFLLSGGVAGLSLVVIGAALIVVQSQRSERAPLEKNLAGLRRVLEPPVEGPAALRRPAGGEGFLLPADTAYHRPTCGL